MGSLTDNFLKVAAAGAETYMASPGKALGASSFNINSATGWPSDTAFIVAIRVVDTSGNEVAGTYSEWLATLSGTTISLGSSPTPVAGNDYNYPAGSTTQVYIPLSSFRDNRLISALLLQHNQDGSHGAITATSLSASGAATAASFRPNNSVLLDGRTNPSFQYTITGTDLTNNYIQITLPHGLGFQPYIPEAYVTNINNGAFTGVNPLPWLVTSNVDYYSQAKPSLEMAIHKVDTTNIIVGIKWFDAVGISIVSSSAGHPLKFVFFCKQNPA